MTPDWWAKLNKQEQEEYIKAHPSTKMKVSAKPSKVSAAPKIIQTPIPTYDVAIKDPQEIIKDFDKYSSEEFIPENLALQALAIEDRIDSIILKFKIARRAFASFKSEAGQRKAIEILKQKPQPNYILAELANNFRGDVLDEVADTIKTKYVGDDNNIPKTYLFSKNYKKFRKAFIETYREAGGTIAHRRSWVALADYGSNANHKFWEGYTPLTESESIPSANLTANLKRLHKETQAFLMKKYKLGSLEELKNHKIDLMRGISLASSITDYAPAVTESWTTDPKTIKLFNTYLKTSIRASAILWTYESLGSDWNENNVIAKQEYCVLGGGLQGVEIKRLANKSL